VLRVAIDGHALRASAGGVRRYVENLWRVMPEVAPDVVGVVVGGDADVAVSLGLAHERRTSWIPTNLGWSAWPLPRGMAAAAADVCHAPAYTAPLWGARPLAVTLHDVSYARHPEWYPHPAGATRRWFYRRSAERADAILTDSTFSKREILAAYGGDERRIHVIALGVDAHFCPDPTVPREPIVLHVGDLHTRRNLVQLLEVVLDLRRSVSALAPLRLVLVGTDRGSLSELRAVAQAAGAADALEHYTGVSEDDLRHWYQRAAVMAYPSRYEGFGLPLLEAMACGTPVVASDAASIPEVTGTAAVLVDPLDRQAWASALHVMLTDAQAATMRSEAGIRRAAEFPWQETARRTVRVWRDLATRS
jgi:alpha-1,3-rhamnosyl/mannosyltransferase